MIRSSLFTGGITLMLATITLSMVGQPIPLSQAATVRAEVSPVVFDQKVHSFSLDNGLQVVVIPDHRLPVVTHMVWYRVGAADEQPGASGLAHFVEHLMFKSCNAVNSETFSQIISRLGGIDNATTNHDATYYFQRVAKKQLRDVMELEARRMAGLQLSDDDIRVELEVIQEERRSNIDNDPIKLLNEQMLATLYQNHRYSVPVLGWAHEIPTLTRVQALAFYRRHYAPNNAVLVVSGDVTNAEVRRLAAEIYGPVKRRSEIVQRRRPTEPRPSAARRVNFVDKRTARTTIFRYYLAPSYASAEPGEAEALDLLISIIGGGETSRLYRHLVTDRNIGAAAGMRYYGEERDSGRLAVFVVAQKDGHISEIEAEMDVVLSEVARNGVTADELARAKSRFEVRSIFTADNQLKRSKRFGEALTAGRKIEDVIAWPRRIMAVDLAQIKTVARKYLQKRRSVTGILTGKADGSAL